MGTPMISAYTATTRIEGFANSFGDSGAQAVSVFTAQNTGAGEERRVREGFRTSFLMMLALGAVMSVLLYAAAPAAIALLAGETSLLHPDQWCGLPADGGVLFTSSASWETPSWATSGAGDR